VIALVRVVSVTVYDVLSVVVTCHFVNECCLDTLVS
jgi:hypothetical protein